jgi:hypothetical protein
MEQAQQEERIGPRLNEHVLVRGPGRLATAWVDDDDLPAAFPDGLEALLDAGRGHDAAVGRERVRADQHHEVGSVDVGDGEKQLMPKHEVRSQHERQQLCAFGFPR